MLGQIVDWFYGQIVGFLGNFFSEMGNMGAELFDMSWVQSVVLFFSYLGWALFAIGTGGSLLRVRRGIFRWTRECQRNGFECHQGLFWRFPFSQVPVRLYVLAVSLQADLTAGITGFGTDQHRGRSKSGAGGFQRRGESDLPANHFALGFGPVTSGLMVIFCLALMAYAVIKVFFANLKRGGILLIQIAVGSLYMFSVPRGYGTDSYSGASRSWGCVSRLFAGHYPCGWLDGV